jgi:hypothetical protein
MDWIHGFGRQIIHEYYSNDYKAEQSQAQCLNIPNKDIYFNPTLKSYTGISSGNGLSLVSHVSKHLRNTQL